MVNLFSDTLNSTICTNLSNNILVVFTLTKLKCLINWLLAICDDIFQFKRTKMWPFFLDSSQCNTRFSIITHWFKLLLSPLRWLLLGQVELRLISIVITSILELIIPWYIISMEGLVIHSCCLPLLCCQCCVVLLSHCCLLEMVLRLYWLLSDHMPRDLIVLFTLAKRRHHHLLI